MKSWTDAVHYIKKDSDAKLNVCREEQNSMSKQIDILKSTIRDIGRECCGWK